MSDGPSSVPIVDLAHDPHRDVVDHNHVAALATEVTDICHRSGFMVVINHGIPQDLIDSVFEFMPRFFSLPEEDKRSIDKLNSPHFRGWEAVGSEYTNGRPDLREQIDIWSEWPSRGRPAQPHYLRLLGPNQWPPLTLIDGFEDLMKQWYADMGALANRLLGLLSLGLGLDQDHIVGAFGAEPMSLTKLIHYPPTPEGSAGVNAHHDAGFLTVLAPGPTPGLQVQLADGTWHSLAGVPGGLIVNLGEMLQGITGNYLVATPHRVITDQERFSAAYFQGPSLDFPLDLLPLAPKYAAAVAASPRHSGAGYMARREETESGVGDMASSHIVATYGEQLWNYFSRSYPRNMARHHPDLS